MITRSAKRMIVAADIRPLLEDARTEGRTCGERLAGQSLEEFRLSFEAVQAGIRWSDHHGVVIDGAAASRYVTAFVSAAEHARHEVTRG